MTLLILLFCILSLVLLITWAKINPFLAFLIVSTMAALLLGMPVGKVTQSVNKGLGDTLGSLVIIIVLGAMLGKLVALSGAAQKIASVLKNIFGTKYITWAMMITGFIVGIPLFYNVAFVLLVPIIFSVAYQYKLPLVYIGCPMLASLSVMHGFVPPHPSPMALIVLFHADLSRTFLLGLVIAVPASIVAGPVFANAVKKIKSNAVITMPVQQLSDEELPGIVNSILSSLLPVLIIAASIIVSKNFSNNIQVKKIADFLGDPNMAMIETIIIATYTLGIATGKKLSDIMNIYAEAVKDIGMVMLIIGGAGILKQILIDSGASNEIAGFLQDIHLPILFLAWLITAIFRLSLGSATVSGLTAAGIIYPLTLHSQVSPSLLVLAIGAGSMFCSHVNDTAFWLFKEYFGLSMKNTFLSWSLMETLVSVMGLIGVLGLSMLHL